MLAKSRLEGYVEKKLQGKRLDLDWKEMVRMVLITEAASIAILYAKSIFPSQWMKPKQYSMVTSILSRANWAQHSSWSSVSSLPVWFLSGPKSWLFYIFYQFIALKVVSLR